MARDLLDLRRDALARHLRQHVQGEVRFDPPTRKLYSTDASIYQIEPLGVVLPRTVDDVRATVQIAGESAVPITARGGGTSLSGQSIGPGLIVDCSKYLNQLIALDPIRRRARIQPGLVLDEFNRALAPHGLQFGPDVATASRANLGGMIGNNSAGARSIVYGKTLDHVLRLDAVLANGRSATFEPLTPAQWDTAAAAATPLGRLYCRVREIIARNRTEIERRFPRILRRVSGYNLDALADGLFGKPGSDDRPGAGLHQLLVGSEGTLGLTTEAEVALVPRPRARGLLVPQFESLAAALDALAPCLEVGPSAVELLDHLLLELSANNLALRGTMDLIQGRPRAVLMVECSAHEPGEVVDRLERLRRRLEGVPGLTAATLALDPATRDPLWDLRRAAMPLLYGMPGDRKPVTFVEDTAVAPERLPEFAARFREILHRHGTDGAFYGHASVGCLHIRPVLNLKDADDVARMRRITADVTDLVLAFGGSLSGEHGDGLLRSEWNEKMFGPVIYRAFCEIKDAFDPQGLLNPGKIVRAGPMTDHLRYDAHYRPYELPTVFDYAKQEGFTRAVEACNGAGVCRKLQGGTMCPSFRATRDERDSTRGRANALRLALAGEQPLDDLQSPWLHEVMDLCLMCKGCKAECPSNVDLAKMKAEFLEVYHRKRRRPVSHWLVAHLGRLHRLAAPFAPLANWLQEQRLIRRLLESVAGVSRHRHLPRLHADHFRRWFARHRPDPRAGNRGQALLLADCFTTYNEPAIGQAATRVLERAGFGLELADLPCCGRTLLSKGYLREARHLVETHAPRLARQLAAGRPLLGLEPSCLLTLADEWTELVPGPTTRRIADAAHLADGWLAKQVRAERCHLEFQPRAEHGLVHPHCHQKALGAANGTLAALALVPELNVTALDVGCCGMAGSFGYEADHYELSVRIANLALLPALAEAPQATIVALGTSCRHQIRDLANRRALHPLELLAQQLT